MNFEETLKLAFVDELRNIHAARGLEVPDLAQLTDNTRLHELFKEAAFLDALKGMGQAAAGAGRQLAAKVSPNARLMHAAAHEGIGDVAHSALKASAPSARLEQWGKLQRMTPVEKVRHAGFATAGREAQSITQATKSMGGTSVGKRVLGGGVEGVGAHYGHKGLVGIASNPLGVGIGGAAEGVTRQVGRELVHSTGLAGELGGGGIRGAAGRGLQGAAKGVGMATEIGALGGMGAATHLPLSVAGVTGTGVLKGLGAKQALVGALGDHGAHTVADAVGTATHGMGDRLKGFMGLGGGAAHAVAH